jgi:hypothetical protein
VFFLFFTPKNEKSDCFEIYKGEKTIEIPVTKDTVIAVNSVEIKIENGNAKIIKSDCKNQICVAAKSINSNGQIVCVPNKVMVFIHTKKVKADVYAY